MIPFKLIFKLIKRILFKPISFIIINIRKSTINSLKNTFIHKKEQKTWKQRRNFTINVE